MNGKFFSQQLGSISRKHKQVDHSHRPKGQRNATNSLDFLSQGAGQNFQAILKSPQGLLGLSEASLLG